MAARYYLHQQYDPMIVAAAQQSGINPNLLRGLLWQESNFDPKQTGPMTHLGTAKGIAQLTPDTQAEYGVKDPYDPAQAIPAAARFLAKYRQVAVDRGYQNPDAYAAMVYYGGPGFKGPDVRPPPGVPGPSIGEYASSVVNHANNFSALASGQPLPAASPAQLAGMSGQPRPVAGPNVAGAPPGLQPTSGPLPTNWADVPGAPASMRYAPPSMFTASSPEEQARWAAASTPQGYEAAVRALAGSGSASPAAGVQEDPSRSVPTVLPSRPAIAGPGTMMPPAGGSQSWAGVPGLPGSPSGPSSSGPATAPDGGQGGGLVSSATQPVYDPASGTFRQVPRPAALGPAQQMPLITGAGTVMPPAGGSQGWAGYPGAPGGPSGSSTPAGDTLTMAPEPMPSAPSGKRNLSDAEIAKIGPEDVLSTVGRDDLTQADRAALQYRLQALSGGM